MEGSIHFEIYRLYILFGVGHSGQEGKKENTTGRSQTVLFLTNKVFLQDKLFQNYFNSICSICMQHSTSVLSSAS